MATLHQDNVACPQCGELCVVLLADSIAIDQMPWVLDNVLDETLHRARCPRCQLSFTVEKELLYTDLGRGHWVGVLPPREALHFTVHGEAVRAAFEQAMVTHAPPSLARAAERFEVRLVFGLPELREKLLCWLNGLDDRVVELLKLDLLADRPEQLRAGVCGLRLDAVFADGALGFLTLRLADAYIDEIAPGLHVPPSLYAEVAAAAPTLATAHRDLFAGPYVNLLRYAAPKPAAPASSTTQP